MSEFRRVKDLLAYERVQASERPSRLCASSGKIKSFSSRTSSGMVYRVEEVLRVAKVGSKRTPNHPVSCSEAQGGREGSERRLYPQIKEQWPRREARKKLIAKSLGRPGKIQTVARKLKDPFWWSRSGEAVLKPISDLKILAWRMFLR